MPTLPGSHITQEVAASFGAHAARYDRARPSYPQELFDRLVASAPGPEILDVGCGTGISSRVLRTAGAHVLGLDTDERMTEVARQSGLDVEVSPFETWDAGDRRFDAVTSAQAWHWIDPAGGAAKAAEVLRPGGLAALIWNAAQMPHHIAREFTEVYRRVVPGSPMVTQAERVAGASMADGYRSLGRKGIDAMVGTGAFGEAEQWSAEWTWVYSRDAWLDVVPTQGGHNLLPAAQLDALSAGFGEVIDAAGGEFTMDYTTIVLIARRLGGNP